MLVYLNMFPINQPEVLISHAMDRFDQKGNLTDVSTREHIIGLLQNLVDWTRRIGPEWTEGRTDRRDLFKSNARK
jgi:chromate reductase